jgi:hypothetical protein
MDTKSALRKAREHDEAERQRAAALDRRRKEAKRDRETKAERELHEEIATTLVLLEKAGLPGVQLVRCWTPRRLRKGTYRHFERPGWEIYRREYREATEAEYMTTERTYLLADGRIAVGGYVQTVAQFMSDRGWPYSKATIRPHVVNGVRSLRSKLASGCP